MKIATHDGTARAWEFAPDRVGPGPAVVFYMDGIGPRPALFEMAERIAQHGYFVLLPDMFYRAIPYESPDPKRLFSDPEIRAAWRDKIAASTSRETAMRDTESFLAYLATHKAVSSPRVGTTGYCMGGAFSLSAAGTYPDRVVAAASFHGGNLANDEPASPHLLAPKIKARVYIAAAIEDPSFPDDMKQRLDTALAEAHVDYKIETYPARHGWVPRDTPVHDAAQVERHWQALFELFDSTLRA
ncbi:MAG TPA: dienelactone hydrolase family protein [Kofleriaceae bacterium]